MVGYTSIQICDRRREQVSPDGFVVLLTRKGTPMVTAPLQTPVERLRGVSAPQQAGTSPVLSLLMTSGVDTEAVGSVEALTLLQLAQQPSIDMGIKLPYDALAKLTGNEDAVLGAVVINPPGDSSVGSGAVFTFTLLTALAGGVFTITDAWTAVALALRYESLGCRIFIEDFHFDVAAVDSAVAFPLALSRASAAAEGASAMEGLRRAFGTAQPADDDDDDRGPPPAASN